MDIGVIALVKFPFGINDALGLLGSCSAVEVNQPLAPNRPMQDWELFSDDIRIQCPRFRDHAPSLLQCPDELITSDLSAFQDADQSFWWQNPPCMNRDSNHNALLRMEKVMMTSANMA
jgi:hypothetical protein